MVELCYAGCLLLDQAVTWAMPAVAAQVSTGVVSDPNSGRFSRRTGEHRGCFRFCAMLRWVPAAGPSSDLGHASSGSTGEHRVCYRFRSRQVQPADRVACVPCCLHEAVEVRLAVSRHPQAQSFLQLCLLLPTYAHTHTRTHTHTHIHTDLGETAGSPLCHGFWQRCQWQMPHSTRGGAGGKEPQPP